MSWPELWTLDLISPALETLWGALPRVAPQVTLTQPTLLQARISERQLMGWQLQIARGDSGVWTTLAGQESGNGNQEPGFEVQSAAGLFDLATLDPARFANGVYQIRLTAWGLAGQMSEIDGRGRGRG